MTSETNEKASKHSSIFEKLGPIRPVFFPSQWCDHGGHENKWLKVLIRKLPDWCWLHVYECVVCYQGPALNTLLLTKSITRKHHDAIKVPFFGLYFDLALFHLLLNCTSDDVAFGGEREREIERQYPHLSIYSKMWLRGNENKHFKKLFSSTLILSKLSVSTSFFKNLFYWE